MRAARSSATSIRRVGHGPTGPNGCGPRRHRRQRRAGWHHGHRPRVSAWCITATDNTTLPNTSTGACASRSGNRSTTSACPVTAELRADHHPPTDPNSPQPAAAPDEARTRPRPRIPRRREAPEPHAAPPPADSHHRPTTHAEPRHTRNHPLQHRTVAVDERTVGNRQQHVVTVVTTRPQPPERVRTRPRRPSPPAHAGLAGPRWPAHVGTGPR